MKTGFIQSGEQKTKHGFNCSFQLPNGGYTGDGDFSEVHNERTRLQVTAREIPIACQR